MGIFKLNCVDYMGGGGDISIIHLRNGVTDTMGYITIKFVKE